MVKSKKSNHFQWKKGFQFSLANKVSQWWKGFNRSYSKIIWRVCAADPQKQSSRPLWFRKRRVQIKQTKFQLLYFAKGECSRLLKSHLLKCLWNFGESNFWLSKPLLESFAWAAAAAVASVMCDSVRPHRRQPTRLPPSLRFSRQEYWSGLPFPSLMHESEKWKWSRSVVSDS